MRPNQPPALLRSGAHALVGYRKLSRCVGAMLAAASIIQETFSTPADGVKPANSMAHMAAW